MMIMMMMMISQASSKNESERETKSVHIEGAFGPSERGFCS